jgi:DNA-directed RNA polymerase delta subunit
MKKEIQINENIAKKANPSFFELASELLTNLPQRSQEIVKKRFGLLDGKTETLEKIGKDYDITRERVRQIITDSIKKISKYSDMDIFRAAEEKIILAIGQRNGIISEEKLIKNLGFAHPGEASSVIFFATCSSKIIEIEEKGTVKKSRALSGDILIKVMDIADLAKTVLNLSGSPLTDDEITKRIIKKKSELSKDEVLNFLSILSNISKNKFGKWGFSNWMEINPKGTRERIYLVMKEHKKPLHFTRIAKIIDDLGISKRKSHPQTVHNELIKDERFVLIGRGIYALREWGYSPGAVKDVLEEILRKSGKHMSKEEILTEIEKFRKVKKTTVMINLNNNIKFIKHGDKYALKA